MIDFHSHILPGIDDGSKDILETKELLTQEYQQGVQDILATPHFYASQQSIPRFLEKRENSRKQLLALEETESALPRLRLAAEVYYFPGMGKADMLPQLCMEGSSLLLLELPFAQWTEGMVQDVKNILQKQRLTVLLAHVERYAAFQKNTAAWETMLELPLYLQINAGSLMKHGKKRRFALRMIKNGYPVVLGTDCHNIVSRPPNLAEARAVLTAKLGEHCLQQMDALGRELWDHA